MPPILASPDAKIDTILQEAGKILFSDDVETVRGDDLGGLFGVVGTEDEDALSVQQEGVQVGDADAFAREELDAATPASRRTL